MRLATTFGPLDGVVTARSVSLTTYLTQSLISVLFVYHYGFGWYGHFGYDGLIVEWIWSASSANAGTTRSSGNSRSHLNALAGIRPTADAGLRACYFAVPYGLAQSPATLAAPIAVWLLAAGKARPSICW